MIPGIVQGSAPPGLISRLMPPVMPSAAGGEDSRGARVPDFRGKSVREVVEEASAEGIELMLEGSGVARAQVPKAGAPLHRGERIRVVLTR